MMHVKGYLIDFVLFMIYSYVLIQVIGSQEQKHLENLWIPWLPFVFLSSKHALSRYGLVSSSLSLTNLFPFMKKWNIILRNQSPTANSSCIFQQMHQTYYFFWTSNESNLLIWLLLSNAFLTPKSALKPAPHVSMGAKTKWQT